MALKKVAGLWKRDGKPGKEGEPKKEDYLSGTLSEALPAGTKIMVFKNTRRREGKNDPHWELMIPVDDNGAPQQKRGGQRQQGQRDSQSKPAQPAAAPQAAPAPAAAGKNLRF